MIGSPASERAFQASQSPLTLRQTRLTVFLSHGAAEQSRERPSHPAGVGSGKIGAGDQRVGLFGAPLIGRNGRILPLGRLAVRCFQTGAGHADRHRSEGSHQLALAMAVPVAGRPSRPCGTLRCGERRPLIALARQCGVELRFQQILDEAANARAHRRLQRIEPISSEENVPFRRIGRRFHGNCFHGVISVGASTPIRFERTNWRLRRLQIPTTPATAPSRRALTLPSLLS